MCLQFSHIRILRHDIVDELLQLVVSRVDIDPLSPDPVAPRGKLVQTLLTATSDDDDGFAVEVMDRQREGTTYAGGSPDDEDTFRVFDACHECRAITVSGYQIVSKETFKTRTYIYIGQLTRLKGQGLRADEGLHCFGLSHVS